MTETLEARIQRHEGFCEFAKPDAGSAFEIGFGHDITAAQASNDYANGISYPEAINLLEADIARCTDQVDTALPVYEKLDNTRQDVLVEMCYQLGINGLLAFKNMIAALESFDFAKAAYEMINSNWHKQTPARCEELSQLMLTGASNES